MKSILVISKSPLYSDPRVYKQILFLKQDGRFRVVIAGKKPSGIEDVFFLIPELPRNRSGIWSLLSRDRIRKAFQLQLGRHDEYYWSDRELNKANEQLAAGSEEFSLVIANDIPVLPLALRISETHRATIYLGAHEYEPKHHAHLLFNLFYSRYWYSICKQYLPAVQCMTMVAKESPRNTQIISACVVTS